MYIHIRSSLHYTVMDFFQFCLIFKFSLLVFAYRMIFFETITGVKIIQFLDSMSQKWKKWDWTWIGLNVSMCTGHWIVGNFWKARIGLWNGALNTQSPIWRNLSWSRKKLSVRCGQMINTRLINTSKEIVVLKCQLDRIYFYQKHAKVLNQPIFVGFFLNFIFMVAKSKYFQFCFIFKNIFEIIVRKLF